MQHEGLMQIMIHGADCLWLASDSPKDGSRSHEQKDFLRRHNVFDGLAEFQSVSIWNFTDKPLSDHIVGKPVQEISHFTTTALTFSKVEFCKTRDSSGGRAMCDNEGMGIDKSRRSLPSDGLSCVSILHKIPGISAAPLWFRIREQRTASGDFSESDTIRVSHLAFNNLSFV